MRDIVFSSIVGSHMYGLSKEGSDLDIREFAMPAFEDFYDNTICLDSKVEEKVDKVIFDIRKFPLYLYNSNPNTFDILFSNEIIIADNVAYKSYMKYILSNKEQIARMNIKKLYFSCMGMYFKHWQSMKVKTEQNKESFEKYGYNVKNMLICYRVFELLNGILTNNSIESIIRFEDEKKKEFALDIINGKFSLVEAEKLLSETNTVMQNKKDVFSTYQINMKLFEEILEKTKNLVKICFTRKMLDEILYSVQEKQ